MASTPNTIAAPKRPVLTSYLVTNGYVTEEQCIEALQRQVIFGGKLGTNLMELLYIDEGRLLEGLSKSLRIPIADPARLERISPSLLENFPQDLAKKFQVIPFNDVKGRIHLAMSDPKDMDAIDAISFISGKVVVPHVTTELKMGFLLEKHFGVERNRRFVSIPEVEMARRREWEEKRKQKEIANQEGTGASSAPRPEKKDGASVTDAGDGSCITEEQPAFDTTTFHGASHALTDARNRDDIASTLLTFADVHTERTILFVVKAKEIQAWKLAGIWSRHENINLVRFPRTAATVIQKVALEKAPYIGPLDRTEIHEKIIGTLGPPYPKEIAAFPLAIRKKVFAVLYMDNGITGDDFGNLTELRKISLKAALAFEVLILKAKIRFQT